MNSSGSTTTADGLGQVLRKEIKLGRFTGNFVKVTIVEGRGVPRIGVYRLKVLCM